MTQKKHATYTAILSNYNDSPYLPGTIARLLNQTVAFDELLLIDDASTDDSVAIMRRLTADVPYVRVLVNPENIGVVGAFNRGLAEATGDFIFCLSADDQYSAHLVEWAEQALALNPDVALIAGNARVLHVDTGEEEHLILPFASEFATYTPSELEHMMDRRRLTFFGGANLLRRQTVLDMGGLRAPLQWSSDWFLYLAIALRYPFAIVPHELTCIKVSGKQYSSRMQQWKYQRPVIEAFLKMLQNDYADLYPVFRRHALLPTYDFQALRLLLITPQYRHFITPLLLWRLAVYKPLRFMARQLIPRRYFAAVRRMVKL